MRLAYLYLLVAVYLCWTSMIWHKSSAHLSVGAERDAGGHFAVAVVSEQDGARLLGARVVRRQVGRVPARLRPHAHLHQTN